MAKKETAYIKLQIPAGKANPSPPVGPALGQHGVNIMEFCKNFNARTLHLFFYSKRLVCRKDLVIRRLNVLQKLAGTKSGRLLS